MNKTAVFVLGLIGSILGILGSIFWILFGAGFIGGIVDHDLPLDAPLTGVALAVGFIISITQSVITISLFIVALVKSTPFSLDKGMKSSGVWLLVIGVVTVIINLFHIIPCVLIIIAGALSLQGGNKQGSTITQNDMSTNAE